MRSIRTDLALETHEIRAKRGVIDGVVKKNERIGDVDVTSVTVSAEGADAAGMAAGTYISADIGKIWQTDRQAFDAAARLICGLIRRVAPDTRGCELAVGLGNERITPDSVGPKTVRRLVVTRHIKQLNEQLFTSAGFGECAAIAPGVLGQTGIESAEIITAAAKTVKPSCLIVIDALASRRLARLATTVQLSGTGISPGSGVCNSRSEISEATVGYPVVSLGFPTVVDADTLTLDMLEESGVGGDELEKAAERLEGGRGGALFVSLKEIDLITDCLSRLAAEAINLFIHKEMSVGEMDEYTSL